LAKRAIQCKLKSMVRLRILSAVLGCLAAFAAGLPTVAFASARTGNAVPMHMTASEPCEHCPGCDGTPCPPAAIACTVTCQGSLPTLDTVSLVLPMIEIGKIAWPRQLAELQGRSSPPDPFPPRL
jgi:hypothetical protein